jgi:site-specific recombinase XerD
MSVTDTACRGHFTTRKAPAPGDNPWGATSDSLTAWIERYLALAVRGVRSDGVAHKIALHLARFAAFFTEAYGHERLSSCLRRDVVAWQTALIRQGLAPATINNHLASLSAFTTWVCAQAPQVFPSGDPTKGIGGLGLAPPEPRALRPAQVRTLKSLCDRLDRYHQRRPRRGRRRSRSEQEAPPLRAHGRPWRDRAIVYLLLSTGLRREELVRLDLIQLHPHTTEDLRRAHRARLSRVRGKGKTERSVFLSADARAALADYLERERPRDATATSASLFLSAVGLPARAADGHLSPRAVNLILARIGRWHDAELADTRRHVSPLRPHDLRHTFAFHLAAATGADAYELERRLGHRSQRYIQRYTHPPDDVAAAYVEEF